ncbi:hypothetical protein P3L10_025263 [Capsicum annuum]
MTCELLLLKGSPEKLKKNDKSRAGFAVYHRKSQASPISFDFSFFLCVNEGEGSSNEKSFFLFSSKNSVRIDDGEVSSVSEWKLRVYGEGLILCICLSALCFVCECVCVSCFCEGIVRKKEEEHGMLSIFSF